MLAANRFSVNLDTKSLANSGGSRIFGHTRILRIPYGRIMTELIWHSWTFCGERWKKYSCFVSVVGLGCRYLLCRLLFWKCRYSIKFEFVFISPSTLNLSIIFLFCHIKGKAWTADKESVLVIGLLISIIIFLGSISPWLCRLICCVLMLTDT